MATSWRLVGGLSASIAGAITWGSRYGWNRALQPVTPALVEAFPEDTNASASSPIAASSAWWALGVLLLVLVLMPSLSFGRYPQRDRDGGHRESVDDDANLYEKKARGKFVDSASIAAGVSCDDVAATSLTVIADVITSAPTNSQGGLPCPGFDTVVGTELGCFVPLADDRMASVSLDLAIAADESACRTAERVGENTLLATCTAMDATTASGADRNDEPSVVHKSSPLAVEEAERSCASAHDNSIAMVASPEAFVEAINTGRIGCASRDKPLHIMGGYPSRTVRIEASSADTDAGGNGSRQPLRGDHIKVICKSGASADDFVVISTEPIGPSPSAEEAPPKAHSTIVSSVMEAIRTPVTFADVTAGVRAVADVLELDTTIIDGQPMAKAETACDQAGTRAQGIDEEENSNVMVEVPPVLVEHVATSTNILGVSAGEVVDDPWSPLVNMGVFLAQAVGLDAYEHASMESSSTVGIHSHHPPSDDAHGNRANPPIKDDISTRGVSWDARSELGGLLRPVMDNVGGACEFVAIRKEISAVVPLADDAVAVTTAGANSPVELPVARSESTEKTAEANSDNLLVAFGASASLHHATDDFGADPTRPNTMSESLQLPAECAFNDNDVTRIVAPLETIADNADSTPRTPDDHWKPLHTMGTLLARAVGMEASRADADEEETNGSSRVTPALSEVFLVPSCHSRQSQTHSEKFDIFPLGSSDSREKSKESASFGDSGANTDAMLSHMKLIGRWHSRSLKEEELCDDLTTEDGAEHTDSSTKDLEASVAENREHYFPSSWLSSLRVVDSYFHGIEAVEAMDDRNSVASREQGGVVLAREFLFGTEQSPMVQVQAQHSACASSSSSSRWRPKASAIGGARRRSAILTQEFGAIGMQVGPRLSSGSDATESAYDSLATSFLPSFTRGSVALLERAPTDCTFRAQSAIDSAASTPGLHMEQIAAVVAGQPEALWDDESCSLVRRIK